MTRIAIGRSKAGRLAGATLLSLLCLHAFAQERVAIKNVHNARAALQGAKAVARAGRGQLLAVGGLMTESSEPSNSLVILARVDEADIKQGMVLILEKLDCATEVCLIARRVTSTQGKIDTEPYPSIEGLLFKEVSARVLGAVAYSVDLDNATIRDLHPGHEKILSFDDAIAQERRTLTSALVHP
jgi:hypothetical protein